MIVNLGKYKSHSTTVFTGRPQGKQVRDELGLDKIDKSKEIVTFIIPEDTSSINPSFFLGLLFESYKFLKDKFLEKYKFELKETSLPQLIKIGQYNQWNCGYNKYTKYEK